jgi:outer membrane protein assembly factor BamB/orotate phosphoribosyltransferase
VQRSFASTTDSCAASAALDRAELRCALVNRGLKLGEGIDRRGRPGGWTLDCREVLLMSRPLMLAARLLWQQLRPYRPAMIGGMTVSADPLTVALLYEAMRDGHELSGFLVRKAPKGAGLRKQVEGPPIRPGVRVALVDDLINTGVTLNRTLGALEPYNPEVVAIAVVVDFEATGSRILREEDVVPFEHLFTLRELGIRSVGASPNRQEPVWTWSASAVELDATPVGEPAIAGNWIYAAIGTRQLMALRDETEQWSFRFRSPGSGTPTPPVVHEGAICIAAPDGYVYALSAYGGGLHWETPLAVQAASQTIDSERGLLIVGGAAGAEGRLAALRIEDGFVTWETAAAAPIRATCVDLQRAQVIIGTDDGTIGAYDASAGRLRWTTRTRGAVRGAPCVDRDGRCFAGSRDGLLYALDADSGRQLWTRRLGRFVDSAPLVADDLVVAGGPTHLVALERSTGTIRWVAATGGQVTGAVAARDAALICGSTDGGVYIVDRESGSVLSRYPTGGAIRSRPAMDGDRYAVASDNGKLYGFRVAGTWPPHPHQARRAS